MTSTLTAMSAKLHLVVVVTETLTASSESAAEKQYDNFSSVEEQVPIAWSWELMTWSWYVICEFVIAILGIIGNALVIAVVFGRRSKRRSTDILVGNLAIADFLTSILLVPYAKVKSIPNSWVGALFCKLMEGEYLMWTAIMASIYSLVAVSFDRFFAVVYPIQFKRFASPRLVNIIVCLIWMGSSVLMVRILLTNTTDVTKGKCLYQRPPRDEQIIFGIYVFVVKLVLPTFLMLVTQIAIARSLRRQAARFASNETTASFHQIARSRVLTLTLTVVLIYVICWTPDQIAFISFNLGLLTPSFLRSPFARVVTALAICNSCVNPILYTLRHPQFREAVKDFFRNTSKRNAPIFEDVELTYRSDKTHENIVKT
ncbi:kappa-type opioid receptor-like [Diadema antillarum]|uniref:kappa-type opioid receptor-like n=1 Tax=Diadema antillarum TaxID=105358 RepID=UPI003A89BA37